MEFTPNANAVKRRRTDSGATTATHSTAAKGWTAVTAWITENGGTVHPALRYTNRTLSTSVALPINTVLLSLPAQCKLSIANASTPQLNTIMQDDHRFHTLQTDVHLACCVTMLLTGTSTNLASTSFFAPYAASLPLNTAHNTVLRRWSDAELSRLLQGSPLAARAKSDRQGVLNDYQKLTQLWRNVPSFEVYDRALAIVSSRAFAEMAVLPNLGTSSVSSDSSSSSSSSSSKRSPTKVDAMLPFVDLMNHTRGGARESKNVRYDLIPKNHSVEVRTIKKIEVGGQLCNTYGTKGNAQLLSAYGFCVENNTELDGSSNDVLEFDMYGETIELRAGGKAYTFGPLCRAIELCRAGMHVGESESGVAIAASTAAGTADAANAANAADAADAAADEEQRFMDMMDGKQNFMDMMEGEGMDEMGGGMGMGGMFDNDEEDDDEEDAATSQADLLADCLVLEKVLCIMNDRSNSYSKETSTGSGSDKHTYANIIIQSELCTLALFQRAIHLILKKLEPRRKQNCNNTKVSASPIVALGAISTVLEDPVMEKHSQALCNAFVMIRHPE